MANFCKQCSEEILGEDSRDMAGLWPKESYTDDVGIGVICEGCGPTMVDVDGRCMVKDCVKKHDAAFNRRCPVPESCPTIEMVMQAVESGLTIDPCLTLLHHKPFFVAMCECGRQNAAGPNQLRMLEICGWRRMPHPNAAYVEVGCTIWKCPFCAGTEAQLRRVFDGDDEGAQKEKVDGNKT